MNLFKNKPKCESCSKKLKSNENYRNPDNTEIILCKKCFDICLEKRINKIKSLPVKNCMDKTSRDYALNIQDYMEKKKPDIERRKVEREKKSVELLKKIKQKNENKKFIYYLGSDIDIRGKKALYIVGEDTAVNYCIDTIYSYLISNGITSIILLSSNQDGGIKEFEFIISDFLDKIRKELIELIDNSCRHYEEGSLLKEIIGYYTCRYCKCHFNATNSFVCPRCGRTN